MGSRSNRSRRYSEEFKRDAAALVRSSGRTVTEVARGLSQALTTAAAPTTWKCSSPTSTTSTSGTECRFYSPIRLDLDEPKNGSCHISRLVVTDDVVAGFRPKP
ncbi:transposase [Streptomyces sp. MRC013]|uniref:transposase n=1 Tax=Streptomyces sp. MRC013 TaxID=2898276 RepID=UPI0032EA2B54